MDGPPGSMPFSAVSVPAPATPRLAQIISARPSARELRSAPLGSPFDGPVGPSYGIDPPRPAKEGFEWVWFPGGYWAERERAEIPTSQSSRVFKWRKRSGRDSSSRETDGSLHSPPLPQQMKNVAYSASQEPPLASPYLTEEAHVLSLQRPSLSTRIASDGSRKSPRTGSGRPPVPPTTSQTGSGRSVSPYTPSERAGPETSLVAEDHQAAVNDRSMSPMSSGSSPLRSRVTPSRKPRRSWLGLISRTREVRSLRP